MTNRVPAISSQHGTLNVRAIVAFFGGRTELVRKLKEHDICEISVHSVSKWQLRNQIPGYRLMDLSALARATGKRFVLSTYIKRAKPAKKKAA